MKGKVEKSDKNLKGHVDFRFGRDGIIHNTIVGEINKDLADRIRREQLEIINKSDAVWGNLCDLNRAGLPTTEARKIGREMFDHKKIGKVALFGMSEFANVIANFMIGITRKRNIRFFRKKEDALKWLKKNS
jgi:hypothetical protein